MKLLIGSGFEVINNEFGKPEILINNEKIESVDISISHCRDFAVANVVILYQD
ncbi:MAG: hypothetical protein HFJ25_03045 [Clostridia bacterium]|jgi:phosphopantetheinyl transferase (holo-ACP synthase)|nr:hypothetical protein [Clostridia bacterium]